MDVIQLNKFIVLMKPFIIAVLCSLYVALMSRKSVIFIATSTFIYLLSRFDCVLALGFSFFAQIPTQMIEIVDSGKSVIEIIIYALTGAATIIGFIKGWGWFKSNKEKRKSVYEENKEMLDHIKDMTGMVQDSNKELLSVSVKSHAEIMRLTHEGEGKDLIIAERNKELSTIKTKCINGCSN